MLSLTNEITSISTSMGNSQNLQFIETPSSRCYFGVHKDAQKNLDFSIVREQIIAKLGLEANIRFVQVIGDSGRFSFKGTLQTKHFLNSHLTENNFVLWGLTGKEDNKLKVREVNQLVTEWLRQNPVRFTRAMANIVDKTCDAIEKWGCSYPEEVKNIFYVGGGSTFGDDTPSSDGLTQVGLLCGGGVQSGLQAINFLLSGVPIYGIYNTRGENNPDTFHKGLGEYLTYFSAGEFLHMLQMRDAKSQEEVEQFKAEYFKTRYLFNPSRDDASTKQALWDEAWGKFIDHKLWERLDLCSFKDVGRTIDQYVKGQVTAPKSQQQHIIITGAPGSGKSSVIDRLKALGMSVVNEAATDVILAEQRKGVVDPWAQGGFREKVVSLQKARRIDAEVIPSDFIYFDRNEIDTLTYCLHLGANPTDKLVSRVQEVVDGRFYNTTVFLIKNLGFCEQNQVRCEDQDEALVIEEMLLESYQKLGFRVVIIPPKSVEERVDEISSYLCYAPEAEKIKRAGLKGLI